VEEAAQPVAEPEQLLVLTVVQLHQKYRTTIELRCDLPG
jgi:hypothetical protein